MENVTYYQSQLNSLNELKKTVESQISDLINAASKEGINLINNKFKKTGQIIGCVVRWAYYDTYVGEKGAMYRGGDYAFNAEDELTGCGGPKEQFEDLYQTIITLKQAENITEEQFTELFGRLKWFFPEYLRPPGKGDYQYKRSPNKFIKDCKKIFEDLTAENNKISYRYSGESEPGECVDGSGFDLGYFDEVYIENFNEDSYEDEFDVFSWKDEISW